MRVRASRGPPSFRGPFEAFSSLLVALGVSRGLLGLAGAFLALLEQNAGVPKTIVLRTKIAFFIVGTGKSWSPLLYLVALGGLVGQMEGFPKPSISVLKNSFFRCGHGQILGFFLSFWRFWVELLGRRQGLGCGRAKSARPARRQALRPWRGGGLKTPQKTAFCSKNHEIEQPAYLDPLASLLVQESSHQGPGGPARGGGGGRQTLNLYFGQATPKKRWSGCRPSRCRKKGRCPLACPGQTVRLNPHLSVSLFAWALGL